MVDKKGVSALIASVMLVAFTVGIGSLVFGFLTNTVKQTTTATSNSTTKALDCSSASIDVQDVYVSGTSSATVNVVVKNTGFSKGLTLTSAVVYNKTGSNFSTPNVPLYGFEPGHIATLTFSSVNMSGGCPAAFSQVIVTTNCGGISDTFDGTPKCV